MAKAKGNATATAGEKPARKEKPSVRLDPKVLGTAREVAAGRGVKVSDYISTLLAPVVAADLVKLKQDAKAAKEAGKAAKAAAKADKPGKAKRATA